MVFSLVTKRSIKKGNLIAGKRHSRISLGCNIASNSTLALGIIGAVIFVIVVTTTSHNSSGNRNSTIENGNLNANNRYSTIDKF